MHVIRLRGPWELLSTVDGADASQRVQIPCDPAELLGEEYRGEARLVRPFNAPTNLDAHERVYVVLERLPASAELMFNGAPLPCPAGAEPTRIDISELLALHNRLEVLLTLPGGRLGEVRLEID